MNLQSEFALLLLAAGAAMVYWLKKKDSSKESVGVGAEFDYRPGPDGYMIIVKHVNAQAPSQNSLKTGDRLTNIGGKRVECKTPTAASELVMKLYGQEGSKVSVVVMRRSGGRHITTPLTLTRATVPQIHDTETEPTPAA